MSGLKERSRAHNREELIERNYREAMALRDLKARRSEVRGEIFANSVSNFGQFVGRKPVAGFVTLSKYLMILGGWGVAALALYAALF